MCQIDKEERCMVGQERSFQIVTVCGKGGGRHGHMYSVTEQFRSLLGTRGKLIGSELEN